MATDASERAIGAILMQKQIVKDKEKEVVIAFGSRTLNPTERKYGTPKKEMLAVVYFCEKFRPYLIQQQFTLRVDNRALSSAVTVAYTPSRGRLLGIDYENNKFIFLQMIKKKYLSNK